MARLGDICKFQSGGTPPKGEPSYFNGNIPWITTVALNGSVIGKENAVDWITEKAIENSAAKIVPANSVMVGTRVGVGKVATNNVPMSTSQDIISLIDIDEQKWSKAFICKFILGKGSYLNSQARGATIKGIKIDTLAELQLPDVAIVEQRKISNVLDSVDNLIFLRKQQLVKLDDLVKARFVELFGATSADKCSKRIKDYAEVLGGYAFKSDLFCADAVPVVRISNINNGCVELDYDICFEELFWEKNKRFRAEQNDILMAMSGATTGKAGIYKENMPALINQRVACIRAKDGIACPMFLFVATQLKWMYDLIQEASAGCAQPNISGKQIENMPVPYATYEQQQQFAAFVEQTDKSKLAIQQSLDKLETLKKSLMQKYFG